MNRLISHATRMLSAAKLVGGALLRPDSPPVLPVAARLAFGNQARGRA